MSNRPIANLFKKYQLIVPNPAAQSALLFLAGLPVAYSFRNAINNTIGTVTRDPRAARMMGMSPKEFQLQIEQALNSTFNKHVVPIATAAIPALAAAALNTDFNKPMWGLGKWAAVNNGLKKQASLWAGDSYQPQLDFSQSVNHRSVLLMFATNPYLQNLNYARNLGTSIIAATPSYGNQSTLGNIYDSAVNKFDTKLQVGGLANTALRGAISGSLAGMYTDVIGAVFGVPDPLRTSLANSVGVGKALYLILT